MLFARPTMRAFSRLRVCSPGRRSPGALGDSGGEDVRSNLAASPAMSRSHDRPEAQASAGQRFCRCNPARKRAHRVRVVGHQRTVRYHVKVRVKPGRERALLEAINRRTLGKGSVAEGEYLRSMNDARFFPDQTARWVEVCYCPTPLQEERPYWEEYFELVRVQDAHDRRRCRDHNGSEPWACGDCDCTARLEAKLKKTGKPFLDLLRGSPVSLSLAAE